MIFVTDGHAEWLIEPEDKVSGSDTESLCMEDCWKYFRGVYLPFWEEVNAPEMILVSTDGYANCFTSNDGFKQAWMDIGTLWAENGADFIQNALPEWLAQSTAEGSGDDITLAAVKRLRDNS